jgi:hypothetical protein
VIDYEIYSDAELDAPEALPGEDAQQIHDRLLSRGKNPLSRDSWGKPQSAFGGKQAVSGGRGNGEAQSFKRSGLVSDRKLRRVASPKSLLLSEGHLVDVRFRRRAAIYLSAFFTIGNKQKFVFL